MSEGKVVMSWIASVAVIAIVPGNLVFLSQSPKPYIEVDSGNTSPACG